MKQRVITGLVGGILFVSLMYLGGMWYSSFILLLALIGFYEFMRMAGIRPFGIAGILGYIILISILSTNFVGLWTVAIKYLSVQQLMAISTSTSEIILPMIILLLLYTVASKNKFNIEHAALTLFGALYIGFGFHYVTIARSYVGMGGFWLTLLIWFAIWSTDSGALFAGRAFGNRKLWPEISPNKTVEGALGGWISAIIVVVVTDWLLLTLNVLGALPLSQAFFIALVTGVVAQLGDLVESAYKRHFGVKDSGRIIPGHGGVLDRFDSMLIVFPILYLFGLY
ncbi:phosphatidate cytidylyltransferase [Brevibacillus daliensis]|uniref:phosphatidate cytidylyltransferase n=1 Tax=Brevibacillus daliensis TaxID=2892995 RepID=UPI001E6595A0|nr:phosphatidate cytidylyltransferase [Brevibacillus daliensis]